MLSNSGVCGGCHDHSPFRCYGYPLTTDITHGFSDGQVAVINDVTGMTGINGTPFTITVINSHSFSIGVSTIGSGLWSGGGVVTPNLRNNAVTINDWPDNYIIPFVQPLQQRVTV